MASPAQTQSDASIRSAPSTLWKTALPLFVLAAGFMISNIVRTLPAIAADVLARDLSISAGDIAALTGFYHLAFAAGQIPVGVALDRYSVKAIASVLLTIIIIGSIFAVLVEGPVSFAFAQIALGIGSCGMLLCPLTYAARTTEPKQFVMWSAVILAIGNSGMIISASPMAWVIEHGGWRLAYGLPAVLALAGIVAVQLLIKPTAPSEQRSAQVWLEIKEVGRIGLSPALRGVVILAFVSFAVMIGVRGLWAGAWLMDTKNMSRLAAGNVLLVLTLMLIVMPLIVGLVEKRIGRAHLILTIGHVLAGVVLIALPAGANGGLIAALFGTAQLPPLYDMTVLIAFGMLISVQSLLFALGRVAVGVQDAGKALSAVNLAFFAGAAVIQALSAPVDTAFGIGGVLSFLGILSIVGALTFWHLRRLV